MNRSPEDRSRLSRILERVLTEMRWFAPGVGYKRWLVLTVIGAMLLGLGLAVVILQYYRSTTNVDIIPILEVLSLRVLARPLQVFAFGAWDCC